MKIPQSLWSWYCADTINTEPRGWYALLEHRRALYGIAAVNALCPFPEEPDLYQHPHWRYIRQFRLWLDRNRCRHCGSAELGLPVHHRRPIKDGGSPYALDNLITLCDPCHRAAHDRIDALKDRAVFSTTTPTRRRLHSEYEIARALTNGRAVSTRWSDV